MNKFLELLQRLSRQLSARSSSRRQSPGIGFRTGRICVVPLEQRVLLAAAPQVTSIQLAAGSSNSGPTIRFTATFSSVVTGVDATDFVSLPSGGISASSLSVVAVSGSVYTITANGVTGTGWLAIRLVDNGTIKGSDGQLLQGGTSGPGAQLADFNSDGRLDLISVTGAQSIGVALGIGDGTFGSFQTTLFANNATTRLLIADLNGDGKLDIVRATFNTSEGSDLLLGQGNGSFTPGAALPYCPTASLLVDVNSDGKLDLIRPLKNLNTNGDITPGNILTSLGNGDGTFQSPIESSDGALPATLFSGDWNNDGHVDLLSTYGYPQNDPEIGNTWVEVRHGRNNGSFNQPVAPNT